MTDDARIPRPALILGLAGLIPFLWSAVTFLSPGLATSAGQWLSPMFIGDYVGLTYGAMILAFMSGVLWGFATKAEGREAAIAYTLSVIPALWTFVMVSDASDTSRIFLAAGFVGLLLLDAMFQAWGLAPRWWLRLRVMLTVVVLASLSLPLQA
ncbi:MAG: DUF3429 domain-containing protein [Rhodobacter sp.]|jgi:hypothetical protein|uniref:DUF3429 domain-containing protein n=1 Tax=Tabrizicola sp. TaxID=2005166 RepID=UPI000BD62676|nr:DUF3429 domain-containing protein [Tabrizicola sp.]MBA3911977.1 DUF3429 domain-containing protein [Rhodobacter sp.]MBY0351072.1 DUF3429 domain-containing protein [Tabrizicola sp.]MDK2775700.1 DUF3429 domain-containing protein [Tabrizicola sp.]OYX20929.1 MAG: DUF3429 domain-containing protein [Rhodobacterales bacterium 32-66-9]